LGVHGNLQSAGRLAYRAAMNPQVLAGALLLFLLRENRQNPQGEPGAAAYDSLAPPPERNKSAAKILMMVWGRQKIRTCSLPPQPKGRALRVYARP